MDSSDVRKRSHFDDFPVDFFSFAYGVRQFLEGKVERASISWKSFCDLVPFYVVDQSQRSCLCVQCYRGKLMTTALYELWPTLHCGATPGSPCTCTCPLCASGGCVDYLPYTSSKTVHSMSKFSDKHMCAMKHLYTASNGTPVHAHGSTCVSGDCLRCARKLRAFFDCSRNKGGADRQLQPVPSTPSSASTPAGEVRWITYTDVDENGQATSRNRRDHPQRGRDNGHDDDYDPRGGAKQNNRQAVAEKKGTVDEFFLEFEVCAASFPKHRTQWKVQRAAFDGCKRTLEEGEVLCVADFQERLQVQDQDEVQSQHWDREATTIYPCPIFFKWQGRVWAYSFQILSDDMAQDNAWVQSVMTKLLSENIPALLREIGAPPMTRFILWTDNCAKQFKCKFHFGYLADCGIEVVDDEGVPTGVRLNIEHHYYCSGHGKNMSDAEGGTTKSYTRMMVTNQRWRVRSSEHLCSLLQESLGFMLREANDEERAEFCQARGGKAIPSEQLVMTKVRLM